MNVWLHLKGMRGKLNAITKRVMKILGCLLSIEKYDIFGTAVSMFFTVICYIRKKIILSSVM
jgi:hypothetical protein